MEEERMERRGGASGKMQDGGRSGFGVLPALAGLPTSISCQRCSKMVAQAASCCTGKKGSLLRMEQRRKKGGGGGGRRRCRGGRGEREGRINSNPSSSFFSVFQSPFASSPSGVSWSSPAQKTRRRKSEGRPKYFKNVVYPSKHTCIVQGNIRMQATHTHE